MSADEEPMYLAELSAALAARAASGDDDSGAQIDWVAVDSHDRVLWVEHSGAASARARLNMLFDLETSTVERVQLLRLVRGQVNWCDWPRRGTPLERARALIRHLRTWEEWSPQALLSAARQHYLRGHVSTMWLDDDRRTGLWLWWLSETQPRVPVGVAVQLSGQDWVLLTDERTPTLAETEVLRRLAECASDACGTEISQATMQNAADGRAAGLHPAERLVVSVALNAARRVGMLPGDWRALDESESR